MAGGNKWANFVSNLFPNQGAIAGNLLSGASGLLSGTNKGIGGGSSIVPNTGFTPVAKPESNNTTMILIVAGIVVVGLLLIFKK